MRGRKVLVVSSNGRLGRRVTDALIAAECVVRHATSEACASVAMLASRFDAVVIDRSLPAHGAAVLLNRLSVLEDAASEVIVISDRDGLAQEAWVNGSTARGSDTVMLLTSICTAMAV